MFVFKLPVSYVSPHVLSTAGIHSDPPAVPFQELISYSTDSSSSSPPQSGWISAAKCPQEVSQSDINYSAGFQPDQQQQPQQQDYSSYYWNNWEYTPTTHQTFNFNTDPSSHYSSSCYYSPETTNQFYYQSYV